jgi:acyl-CoA dehydrogenase
MEFSTPERVAPLLPIVRELVDGHVVPLEREMSAGFGAVEPRLLALRERVRELGLLSPHVAKEHGGAGFRLLEFAFLAEELGRSPLAHFVFNCQAPDAGNMEVLAAHGTAEQRRRWLSPLVKGEVRSCFAMTEPDRPGSNPAWLATTARRQGDRYVIDGRKWFATGADGARFAVIMAVTDPDAASPWMRASMFLTPTDAPGFRHVRNVPVMGHAGDGWASHGEVVFESLEVPASERLGEEGMGFAIAQDRLGPGRIHHCMRWLGICERAFDLMCRRAVSREVAPGRPLGTRQIVQGWIADSRAEIDGARLMVLEAAWAIDREGAGAAREKVAAIKFHVAGVLQRVLDRALQAHGAAGLTDETPLAFWYAHERAARIYDGPDEVHRSSLARRILARHGLEDLR